MFRVAHRCGVALAAAGIVAGVCSSGRAAEPAEKKGEVVLAAGEESPKDHVRPQVLLSVDRLPA
ncbi:MAG TPA: hypothetical protein VF170_11175, partial [Planctomycetaceae bacterium]